VILRGTKSVGIEITRLYLEDGTDLQSEQVQRQRRSDAFNRARDLHLTSCGTVGDLTLVFNSAVPIWDVAGLANDIAGLAAKLADASVGQVQRTMYRHIPLLDAVFVGGQGEGWQYATTYGGYGGFTELQRLQQVVMDKEGKAYRPCASCWLLVVVDFADHIREIPRKLPHLTSTCTHVQ